MSEQLPKTVTELRQLVTTQKKQFMANGAERPTHVALATELEFMIEGSPVEELGPDLLSELIRGGGARGAIETFLGLKVRWDGDSVKVSKPGPEPFVMPFLKG